MGSSGYSFNRRILIPFWVIQLIFVIISLGDAAYLLSVWANGQSSSEENYDPSTDSYDYYTVTYSASPLMLAFYGLTVAFSVVSIILLITEIVLYTRQRLSPKTFFATTLTNFLLWTIVFAMMIAGIVIGYDTILLIVSVVICWVRMAGALIYASIMFRRHRGDSYSGNYTPGNYNPGGHGGIAA
ncbi:hypothetical protein MMC13_005560 [Lambiella insularis]|nr:hypothetical protein [Lambiella insularis]